MPADKLQPRNRTARLATARAAGNPVTTELEAGVGNCFPGLEVDLRNLDRRFFPYLVVDFFRVPVVREVDVQGAQDDGAPAKLIDGLEQLAPGTAGPWQGPAGRWQITTLTGRFAGFGDQTYALAALPTPQEGASPPDAWTAVRLLQPGTEVEVVLSRQNSPSVTLRAVRASYLADDGGFAEMFAPGELTQSLCSPWTHDFRDCGCFYWASNHPDIVQPARPPGVPDEDSRWGGPALWERSDRATTEPPPVPGDHQSQQMAYFEINRRWQEFDVVLDGREQRAPYEPSVVSRNPIPRAKLETTLRYAAGVELGVMLEYVAAAFSLDTDGTTGTVREDAVASQAELLRVAASEMRHLRLVNDLLFDLHQETNPGAGFTPALGVAELLPGPGGVAGDPVVFRPLTPAALTAFVAFEAPSLSVDSLYGDLLATYRRDSEPTHEASVLQIMAEGDDHYESFLNIQEWLGRHTGTPYLRTLAVPPAGDGALDVLQQRYETVLGLLASAYRVRGVTGASSLAAARAAMLGPNGIQGACADLAGNGLLPVFAVPTAFPAVPRP